MEVAVLGLGEAGGRIAADLVAAGCTVRGWDPLRRPAGIPSAASDREAVGGADVVLSMTTAAFALDAAASVAGALDADAVYADLNTSAPQLKRELAATLPVPFADVALIGVVPSLGLATPALASGAGAERFAELFRPLGMPVEVVGAQPGDAAGLKLLRSIFMKGIAAAAIEALEAARAAGAEDRVRARHRGRPRRAPARPPSLRLAPARSPSRRRDAGSRRLRPGAGNRAARGHGCSRMAGRAESRTRRQSAPANAGI